MGRSKNPSVYDLTAAYESLKEANALVLKPVEASQQPASDWEAEAYAMPLDELARRAVKETL